MLEKAIEGIKEFLGEGSEFIQSTHDALQERITSPFYGYFLVSWLIFNWRLVYVAFLIDQETLFEKTGMLRIEYLNSLLPKIFSLELIMQFFILPFLLTILFFWVFPYVTRIFYKKSLLNQQRLSIIAINVSRQEKAEETKLSQEETNLLMQENRRAQEENKIRTTSPEVLWEREFRNFRKTNMYDQFTQIYRLIYQYSGNLNSIPVPTNILAYAHANGLIKYNETNVRRIELTEKGTFFVKLYLESNPSNV